MKRVIVLVAALFAMATASAAFAHNGSFDTKVTMRVTTAGDNFRYAGSVDSGRFCQTGRLVILIEDRGTRNVEIDRGRTTDETNYRLFGPDNPNGPVLYPRQVIAPRSVVERGGHRHVCERDASPKTQVG